MYDAVVFDMDGIIFDSEKVVIETWESIAEKYGIENIRETLYKCIGANVVRTKEIMREAYGEDFPYDDYNKEVSVIYHERCDGGKLPMKPGVFEILEYIKSQGKKLALASSTRRETVINELRDAKILDYFSVIIGGDMIERSKPEPDIYLKACEELGVNPENAFAIEDSFNGIRSAYAGRLRPIMVPDILGPDDEMRDKAEVVLDSLLEVRDYLKKEA